MEYKITYSDRKTIGIYIHLDASVEVRCPKRTSKKIIEEIVNNKKKWIEDSRRKMLASIRKEFSDEEILLFMEKGKNILPGKVEFFANVMGVKPKSVKIGNVKSYWGCCSANNKITFSCRLMQATDDVIDYVVVHELAHIKEHNHSAKFWNEVYKILPDYKSRIKKLKELN